MSAELSPTGRDPLRRLGTTSLTAGLLGLLAIVCADGGVLIGQNQGRTTRWSIPQRLADGIGAVTGGDAGSIVHFTRAALAAALGVAVLYLLRYAWRHRAEPRAWVLTRSGPAQGEGPPMRGLTTRTGSVRAAVL